MVPCSGPLLFVDHYTGQDHLKNHDRIQMNRIYLQLIDTLRSGSRIVLATVVRTSGSTPQKPGSTALFGENGLIAGTVGGGLLEAEVQHIAGSVLISGVSDHYYFNLDADQGGEGAICGGEAVVLIDANPEAHLRALEEMEKSLIQRKGGHLMTTVGMEHENGRSIDRYWIEQKHPETLPHRFDPIFKDAILNHLSGLAVKAFSELEPPESVQASLEMVLFETIKPMPQLVIAGAGHVGKAVAHIGRLLDFEVTVIDDRREFANQENIPDADHFIVQDIGTAMSGLKTGRDTYIVIVTRGHDQDAVALKPCIGSNSAYVGMIGSSHKVGIMKKRFIDAGWASLEEWSHIHTPIGLAIGSKSVQEIAISIAAELVSIRDLNHKKNAQ